MSASLSTLSVKEFMLSSGFSSVVKTVRENSNNYPYVTFITEDNKAENIYFSKNASKIVAAGEEIIKGFFDKFRIAETKNQQGEKRIKLVGIGERLRLSVDDLF